MSNTQRRFAVSGFWVLVVMVVVVASLVVQEGFDLGRLLPLALFLFIGTTMLLVPWAQTVPALSIRVVATLVPNLVLLGLLLGSTVFYPDLDRLSTADISPLKADWSVWLYLPVSVVWIWIGGKFRPGTKEPVADDRADGVDVTPPGVHSRPSIPVAEPAGAGPKSGASSEPTPSAEPPSQPMALPRNDSTAAPEGEVSGRAGRSRWTRAERFTIGITILAAVLSTAGSILANLITK